MKKILLLMFAISSIAFSHGTEVHSTDGTAGASLNEQETIKKYKQLSKLSIEAIKKNDWFKKEHVYDEIEEFLVYINSYDKASSKEAKEDIEKYNRALKKRLIALKKVNGLGGKELNQKQLKLRYDYVSKLSKTAIETDKGKKKAKNEINELAAFIKKWKTNQEADLQKTLSKIESNLQKRLNELKN